MSTPIPYRTIKRQSDGIVEDIINHLDDKTLKEFWMGGMDSDIDGLVADMMEESYSLMKTYSQTVTDFSKYSDISNLGVIVEETYRRASFPFFIDSVLGEKFIISWYHLEWSNYIHLYPKILIEAARDHSKSFLGSWAYPLFKMYRYEKSNKYEVPLEYQLSKEGLLITNEYSLSKKWLKKIREEIEENPILSDKLLPKDRGQWNIESLGTKNGALLELKSYGTSMRGPHPGYIVVDDFLDKTCLYSQDMRDKFTDTFNSEITNMLLPGGQILVTGTPFHINDLYGKLKKSDEWKCFKYPGINSDGSILDPTRHTLDELLSKRITIGTIAFTREILVEPISDASTIFPYSMISKCFDSNWDILSNYYSTPKEFVRIVTGVDIARSANVGADSSVFITLGVDIFDRYWLLDLWTGKGKTLGEQISQLKYRYQLFRPDIIVIENNQMQQLFVDAALVENLPVTPHTTGTNKYDLDKGLPSLALLFEQQRIILPYKSQNSKDISEHLAMQLASMTWTDKGKLEGKDHDDEVMSLLMSVIAARKGTGVDIAML